MQDVRIVYRLTEHEGVWRGLNSNSANQGLSNGRDALFRRSSAVLSAVVRRAQAKHDYRPLVYVPVSPPSASVFERLTLKL